MFEKTLFRSAAVVVALVMLVGTVQAATVVIETVPVGNLDNLDDDHGDGYGGVDHAYNIGKYEVTNAQWREFLTAKASVTDPHGLYNTSMAGSYGGIDRTWSADHYVYTAKGDDENWDGRPVNYVSFWDAARFCNWLHNGQGGGDTESGSYINIGDQVNFTRQPGATYVIPTENEWYKSAYFDPNKGGVGLPGYWDYPMMSDIPMVPSNDLTTPDGGNNANFYQSGSTIGPEYYTTLVGEFELSESPYGTFDQGGNLWEWNETSIAGSSRGLRGGYWYNNSYILLASYRTDIDPPSECHYIGFRVASVPEPGSITLLVSGLLGVLLWWRRRK